MRLLSLLFAIWLLIPRVIAEPAIVLTVPTGSLTFAWDGVTYGENVISYRLYHSMTSGVYSEADRVDAGTVTQYTWVKVFGAGRHYFVCRAYTTVNSVEIESGNSNEVTSSLLPPTGGTGKVNP